MNPLTDANLAQWLSEGDPKAEEASRDIAEALVDPIQINESRLKMGITVEWQLGILKEWILDPEEKHPMSSRLAAFKEMRGILRQIAASNPDLRRKFDLEWIADSLRHGKLKVIEGQVVTGNNDQKQPELPPDVQAAHDKLGEVVNVDIGI